MKQKSSGAQLLEALQRLKVDTRQDLKFIEALQRKKEDIREECHKPHKLSSMCPLLQSTQTVIVRFGNP